MNTIKNALYMSHYDALSCVRRAIHKNTDCQGLDASNDQRLAIADCAMH